MKKGHLHICLYRPEIPQNTGNISRLAAATQCRLHLIEPLGFSMADKNLRRPGLDYWPFLDIETHQHEDELLESFKGRRAFLSKKTQGQVYTDIPRDVELLIFGNETSGLPQTLFDRYPTEFYGIPMFHSGVRSLNLANAVSLVTYHQLWKRLQW